MVLSFIVILSTVLLSYRLTKLKTIGAIRSSCISTIIAFVSLKIFSLSNPTLLAAAFGASFVGMTSKNRCSYVEIIFCALLFTIIFEIITPKLYGLGGALGLSAFLSVIVVINLKNIVFKSKFLLRILS